MLPETPNQALEQTRDSVLRYGESVGYELLNFFVGCREMKTRNIAIVAFMLGVVVASFVCTLLQRSDECARKSAVDMPTAAIIGVINEDLRANRIEDAHAKLRKLEKRFLYFCEGGKTPEQFYHEILTTENDSSQPTNPPYSSPRETQGSKR